MPCEKDSKLEQGKDVRSPPHVEQDAAERTRNELTTTPILCPPVMLVREEVENLGVKLRLGRREEQREGVLRFDCISHYATLL